MRQKLVAGNWKMHLSTDEARDLARSIVESIDNTTPEVLLCPSFTLISAIKDEVEDSPVFLGAQNLFWEPKGAFTGEISAEMILDAGCTHVIIGHSERRQYFGETDASVQRKTATALQAGLIPIVCVGETLEEREEGQTSVVINRQVSGALERFKPEDIRKLVIAYEPVWAIGTGRTATPETAQEVHQLIRAWLIDHSGKEIAETVRILYGGSVKPDNAETLFSQVDIDGGLVGGASLKAEAFSAIIKAAR